ncbi:MAG: hypothetical protein IJN46_07595 [Lachnospiraceae bacterium]|nr:hypothetical protein [Lachnospiraceae bacterium]
MKVIKKSYYAKRISPLDGEYFFGYYDLQPFNGNLHLTHKVADADKLHMPGDVAEIGLLDINTEKYEKLDTTGAWCFQQGAMLQWNPQASDREIIYNSLGDGDYNATIMDIHTGKKRFLDRPVANVSPKGNYALSINMARLYDFRPGYGYAEHRDPFYWKKHSADDGIFLTDLNTGVSRLIISMEQIWEFSKDYFGGVDQKLVVNHITFNTDGTRFLFLVRNFPAKGGSHVTAIITANTDGSDMFLLSDYGVQSHYFWLDKEHVIFYSDGKELACSKGFASNYILKDKTWDGEMVGNSYFRQDNHMSYSPDRKLIITDTYPNAQKMQPLRAISFEKDLCVEIGRFYSMPRSVTDLRCDLHPRWNRDGKMISFDSTHEGQRAVYVVDMEPVLEEFFN